MNYPYKDEQLNRWIYDKIPSEMIKATSTDIKLGASVLFKIELPPLCGLYMFTKITKSSYHAARDKASRGMIYMKKLGFQNNNL